MTIQKINTSIKPSEEVDKINEVIDEVNSNVVSLTGKQSISGTKTFLAKTSMAPIELYPVSLGGPYIDFHYNNSTSDYTSRIIEQASGDLVVTTNDFTIDANAFARASDVNGSIVTTVNKNKAKNGYFQLGNGLIMQWGEIASNSTDTTGTITFPKAFSSKTSYAVVAVSNNASINIGVGSQSATSFQWRKSAGSHYIDWIAIGY